MNEDKKEKYFKRVHKNIDENGFHITARDSLRAQHEQ